MKRYLKIFLPVLFMIPLLVFAGKGDTLNPVSKPIHKNVIKFNPTPMLLWSSKNLTFSYERILNPKQSIAITVGFLEFPSLFKDTIAHIITITSREKYGINLAFEYRFYLMKRNSRPIPDGVFLGPFASFYGYKFNNGFDLVGHLDSAGMLKGKFYAINVGCEFGYQFVFWKRVTLDFVLVGPAVSYYGGGVDISGEIKFSKLKEINEDLYNKLIAKYPMIGDYVVNKSFKSNGKLDLLAVGFRYLVQIGFHF